MIRRTLDFAPLVAAFALLSTSSAALAQAEQDSGATFFTKPAGSAAPNEFGWQLPPDDSGVWTSVPAGDGMDLLLSNFFPDGLVLGRAATGWLHPVNALTAGPPFAIYQSGVVAVFANKNSAAFDGVHGDAPLGGDAAGVGLFKARTFAEMGGLPEILAPRWAEIADTAELAGVEACADKQQVFFLGVAARSRVAAGGRRGPQAGDHLEEHGAAGLGLFEP